jgi:hypothetical protein
MLAIEAKPANALAGITLGPAQVLLYAELFARWLGTVSEGARCNLAYQQQRVAGSILAQFADEIEAHVQRHLPGHKPMLIAAITDLDDGHAVLDEEQGQKQPDWTYNAEDSGQMAGRSPW